MDIQVVLFDIGNTLINDDHTQPGKMIDWQRLEPIADAPGAIHTISRSKACFAASNAQDSMGQEASRALEKAGYKHIFRDIFTSRSLGLTKDCPEFYTEICRLIGFPPAAVLMVGDDLNLDVASAVEAGIKTCFYNPTMDRVNAACLPLQNGEFHHFADLPGLLTSGIHPSIETCLVWLVQSGVSQGVLQHVMMVAAVAYWIALRFCRSGTKVDPILIHRGALLHDIDILHPASSREAHGKVGAAILIEKGYPAIAEIIRRHVPPSTWSQELAPQTWAQKIVFYADKLVNHQRLVTLEERMRGLMERYPANREFLIESTPQIEVVQKEILAVLGMNSDDLHLALSTFIKGRALPG
ncbi:MAG: HDIG domain-containing protein [Anaerolineae bacterium]|nr:HDIG domain-containing protein [Anaerolineae bacterium]